MGFVSVGLRVLMAYFGLRYAGISLCLFLFGVVGLVLLCCCGSIWLLCVLWIPLVCGVMFDCLFCYFAYLLCC